jgi:peptide/nickel transport system substrate-binding protein
MDGRKAPPSKRRLLHGLTRRLNKAALDEVLCAPLGWYLRHFAWRKDLAGVTQGPLPFFWGVSKTV